MATIKINDVNFYYELHGSGHPLVLIGGYTADHTFWWPILEDLSRHYQVLIFDNRASGQTKDDGRPLSTNLMADDVMALCEPLHLKKPHIVGQSMGGTIAQTIAACYPDKIDQLVILTSSARWRETMLLACESLLSMRQHNIDFNLIFDAMLPWIFGEAFLSDTKNIEMLKQAYRENQYPQSLEDQERQCKVLRGFDGRDQLKKIRSSTLVVHATQDLLTLPRESAFMASQILGAKSVELDCAHGIMLEVPKALSKVLIDYLTS